MQKNEKHPGINTRVLTVGPEGLEPPTSTV